MSQSKARTLSQGVLRKFGGGFRKIAHRASLELGKPWSFIAAVSVVLAWVVSGPFFAFSDTWQLVINTGTTVVTFLMVFLIQNTQNRDAQAIHLKLDELIHAVKRARNELVDIEDSTDEEIQQLAKEFKELRKDRRNS